MKTLKGKYNLVKIRVPNTALCIKLADAFWFYCQFCIYTVFTIPLQRYDVAYMKKNELTRCTYIFPEFIFFPPIIHLNSIL